MAEVTISIPNENVAEFLEGYTHLDPIPNGMTGLQHVKAGVIRFCTVKYKKGKRAKAKDSASIIELGIT